MIHMRIQIKQCKSHLLFFYKRRAEKTGINTRQCELQHYSKKKKTVSTHLPSVVSSLSPSLGKHR